MTRSALLVVCLFAIACGGSDAPAPAAAAEPTDPPAPPALETTEKSPYAEAAEALVAAIEGGKAADEIGTMATELMDMGLKELTALREKHPVCDPYFDALVAAAPTLPDLPLDVIESGYHADGKLPKMPDGVCYHGKDLVAHPATVVAMSKSGLTDTAARTAAKAEITEVLGPLGAVEAAP